MVNQHTLSIKSAPAFKDYIVEEITSKHINLSPNKKLNKGIHCIVR